MYPRGIFGSGWMPYAVGLCLVFIGVTVGQAGPGICGDVNGDGNGPNIVDLTYFVAYLFGGGSPPPQVDQADVNADGALNIVDLTVLVNYLFAGGELNCPDRYDHRETSGMCLGDYTGGVYEHEEINNGCEAPMFGDDSTEYMFAEFIGMDLHVFHINAYYQCCLEYMVTWDVDGSSITAYEADTAAEICPCECYFNLEAILYGLEVMEPTQLVVTLVGIDGDTVGVDTVDIGGEELVTFDVIGDDLYINHINAHYQCCLGYYVQYDIEDYVITAQETDTGDLCDCYCYFNLQSILYDIPAGIYDVVVIGIEGDTIGTATVVIGNPPTLIGHGQEGCLPDPRGDVEYTYSEDTLRMDHYDGFFNCAGIIDVEFSQAGDTLRFFEWNVSDEWVYCLCYFHVTATVIGIPPGEYVAEVYARDYPTDPVEMVDQRTIVLGQ